jgi:hypothetical protein
VLFGKKTDVGVGLGNGHAMNVLVAGARPIRGDF